MRRKRLPRSALLLLLPAAAASVPLSTGWRGAAAAAAGGGSSFFGRWRQFGAAGGAGSDIPVLLAGPGYIAETSLAFAACGDDTRRRHTRKTMRSRSVPTTAAEDADPLISSAGRHGSSSSGVLHGQRKEGREGGGDDADAGNGQGGDEHESGGGSQAAVVPQRADQVGDERNGGGNGSGVGGDALVVGCAVDTVNGVASHLLRLVEDVSDNLAFWQQTAQMHPSFQLWTVLCCRGPSLFLRCLLTYFSAPIVRRLLPCPPSANNSAAAAPVAAAPMPPQSLYEQAEGVVWQHMRALSILQRRLLVAVGRVYSSQTLLQADPGGVGLSNAPLAAAPALPSPPVLASSAPPHSHPHPHAHAQATLSGTGAVGPAALPLWTSRVAAAVAACERSVEGLEGSYLGTEDNGFLDRSEVGMGDLVLARPFTFAEAGRVAWMALDVPVRSLFSLFSSSRRNDCGAGGAASASLAPVARARLLPASSAATKLRLALPSNIELDMTTNQQQQGRLEGRRRRWRRLRLGDGFEGQRLVALQRDVEGVERFVAFFLRRYGRPGALARNWVGLLAAAVGMAALARTTALHFSDLRRWYHLAHDSAADFATAHIIQPLAAIRDDVFHTFHSRPREIVDAAEVQDTSQSLRRMLENFVQVSGAHNEAAEAARLALAATRGEQGEAAGGAAEGVDGGDGGKASMSGSDGGSADLDQLPEAALMAALMSHYEREMMKPLQSFLLGHLAQALLIQVQKMKLHIETAMLELDQVLRANEINFAVLAAMPAVMLFFALANVSRGWVLAQVRGGAEGRGRAAQRRRRMLLAQAERMVLMRFSATIANSSSSGHHGALLSLVSATCNRNDASEGGHVGSGSNSSAISDTHCFGTSGGPDSGMNAAAQDRRGVHSTADKDVEEEEEKEEEESAALVHGELVLVLQRLMRSSRGAAMHTGEWESLRADIVELSRVDQDALAKALLVARMGRVYECLACTTRI